MTHPDAAPAVHPVRIDRARDELEWATQAAGNHRAPRRFMMLDDDAPHQIRIFLHKGSGGNLAVSCTCRRQPGGGFAPLETRARWDAGEAQSTWRAHLPAAGAS